MMLNYQRVTARVIAPEVSSLATSPFDVGQREGREWILHILAGAEAAQVRALLDQKRRKFREEGRELREWETGFVHGAEQAIRDSQEER
jgi:hypothetical protein